MYIMCVILCLFSALSRRGGALQISIIIIIIITWRGKCAARISLSTQSGWGFTVKQGVTTIHEDSAAYTVSTSSLTMEVEAVTHALHRNVPIVSIHLPKLLWVYCLGHAGLKGNDRVDRMAGKATLTSGLLLGRSETLRSTTCGHKATGITPSIAWRREALDDIPSKDERGPSSIWRTLEPFSKATLGKLLRDGEERIWAFLSA